MRQAKPNTHGTIRDLFLKNRAKLQVREIDIQRGIVQGLEIQGYRVLVTNVSVRKAAVAAGRDAVGHVCSPGVPDLFVSRPEWPDSIWLGLEVKRPSGRLTKEQAALLAQGRIIVVRGILEALNVVRVYDLTLRRQGVDLAEDLAKAMANAMVVTK